MADFFGADRLIKLMGVTGVDDDRLPAADIADRAAPMIEPEATLRQATIAILASPDGRIRVPGDNNSGDRVLTLESIRKLLRSERAS